ncbi:MAG: 3-isopropylmalate dehydratase small subunit [Chloroflexaceae bacterium]|nr:3-isopropylmalate dehydratase small subunit [Chloroflexaceae bacterium]
MEPITTFTAKAIALPIDNIDTDQIIPARFLKATDKQGMGDALFADWRFDAAGNPRPDFVLNHPEAAGAEVLVAGHNFGCGSSREHAPWALRGHGFKAVISTYFADIFRNNALKNGLLPVTVDAETYRQLVSLCEEGMGTTVTIDLTSLILTLNEGNRQVAFPIDSFARYCLLNGIDQLGFLLQQEEAIAAYEAEHPALVQTIA